MLPRKKPLKRSKTHSWWLKKTKADFNKMIRLQEADENGLLECITCGKIVHYKECDAGHYVHGLDFVEDNQHGQCKRCNMYLSGNLANYTLYMIDRYGRERVDELHLEKHKTHKYSIPELREKREGYRQRIKELEYKHKGD